jgi:hypothetical protein
MKGLAILALVFVQTVAMAQDVPAKVKEACKKKFPAATNVEWVENNGNYEGEFYKNEVGIIGIFDEAGNWLSTRTNIDEKAIPAVVSKAYAVNHKDAYLSNQFKIESNDNTINYEIVMSDDVASYIFLIDSTGKILKTDKQVFSSDEPAE